MSTANVAKEIKVNAPVEPEWKPFLSADALDFLRELHHAFNDRRLELLKQRQERQRRLDQGELPDFLPATANVRNSDWKVAPPPPDLEERKVEITGPADRKMVINALNSGASVFMADFEDSLAPTWANLVQGQLNLHDAVRRQISLEAEGGRVYKLNEKTAVLVVRPRGWHLVEKHVLIDGQPISGSLFDFGLYFYHNAQALRSNGTGAYFYLPKLESHLEARLWSDVFKHAEDRLGVPRGTIRATVLIETILATFEMDEILYELKEHITGLNAGRWDYIFSVIKKFRKREGFYLPDRGQVTMTVPFMRAYTELLVKTCHKRGAHAMGGMAQYIPNRRNPETNRVALQKVRDDKERESRDGFDGTWVAHPDLVPIAMEVFDKHLGNRPNQKERVREDVNVSARDLLNFDIAGGRVTEGGLRNNISVAVQYMGNWLAGRGAVGIFDLMEDAATAEISRSQIWQWLRWGAKMADGRVADRQIYDRLLSEELGKLGGAPEFGEAAKLLTRLIEGDFIEFLTLIAYDRL
jgi:malate synthase